MAIRDTMRRRIVPAVLAAALVLAPATAPAGAAAKGNPKAYAFLSRSSGDPVPIARWNPCKPIRYRVNLDRSASGALADVKGAIARIAQATGLRFTYQGTTKVVPEAAKDYPGTYPIGTDLIVAWVNPGKQSTMLPNVSGLAGMGGGYWTSAYTKKGVPAYMFTRGQVVLNASMKLPGGFGPGNDTGWQGTRGQLLMHEIGHAVGLDHPKIKDQAEIMYPMMAHKAAVWGAGDLNGLKALGTSGGCLYTSDPTAAASAAAITTGHQAQS
ncbi:hypothetical protein [Paractinoplanes globisporus]|uniref:Uncharacterized protein n=1 Tax=Paractinoplanes globisporus TaxID=113565 RepID=A0ABW6W9C6_9ACTN|nr:hypothetical protein [Actinoplanes globisporus]